MVEFTFSSKRERISMTFLSSSQSVRTFSVFHAFISRPPGYSFILKWLSCIILGTFHSYILFGNSITFYLGYFWSDKLLWCSEKKCWEDIGVRKTLYYDDCYVSTRWFCLFSVSNNASIFTHTHTLITLHVNYYFFLFNVLQKMLMDMKQVREKRKQNQFQGKEYYFD